MINARKVLEECIPGSLSTHAIGWDNDNNCRQLLTKLVDAFFMFVPDLQGHIDKQIALSRPNKESATVAREIERLQTLVAIFSSKLRNALEMELTLQVGQKVDCQSVSVVPHCIGKAASATVETVHTAKKGNNNSRRKKFQLGYFLKAS